MKYMMPKDKSHAVSLAHTLTGGVDKGILTNWVGDIADRRVFTAGTVWGSIRWTKGLGRSIGPTLASGFNIQHFGLTSVWLIGVNGKIIHKGGWTHIDDVGAWDLPEDEEFYQVGFGCHAMNFNAIFTPTNKIRVEFASDYGWTAEDLLVVVEGGRYLRPSERIFQYQENLLVLDEFAVGTPLP